jgi:hypothetical protein
MVVAVELDYDRPRMIVFSIKWSWKAYGLVNFIPGGAAW